MLLSWAETLRTRGCNPDLQITKKEQVINAEKRNLALKNLSCIQGYLYKSQIKFSY